MEEQVKKTKAEELKEKVSILAQRLGNERNPVKRVIYSIRSKMVIAKLEREIEMQKIEEMYSGRRAERDGLVEGYKVNTRSGIIAINQQIMEIQEQLEKSRIYDYESPRFIFGTEDVNRSGGVEEYIRILRESGDPGQIEVANRIEECSQLREEMAKLQKKLENKRIVLEQIDAKKEEINKKEEKEKMALVAQNKVGIFTKIRGFFRNVKESIKEVVESQREINAVKNKEKQAKQEAKKTYEQLKFEVQAEYEQKMQRLMEQYQAAQEKIGGIVSEQEQDAIYDSFRVHSQQFRDQMKQMAQKEAKQPKSEEQKTEDVQRGENRQDAQAQEEQENSIERD